MGKEGYIVFLIALTTAALFGIIALKSCERQICLASNPGRVDLCGVNGNDN